METSFYTTTWRYFCIRCRHLGSQLLELEKLIDKMMQEDFVKYTNQDLNRPLDDSTAVMEEVGHIVEGRGLVMEDLVLGVLLYIF